MCCGRWIHECGCTEISFLILNCRTLDVGEEAHALWKDFIFPSRSKMMRWILLYSIARPWKVDSSLREVAFLWVNSTRWREENPKISGLFTIRLASKFCELSNSWISAKREVWRILARSLHCDGEALLKLSGISQSQKQYSNEVDLKNKSGGTV